MKHIEMDDWIVCRQRMLGGKPCIRGTRISVELVLEFLASGQTQQEFFEAYPHVPPEGLAAALYYAAKAMRNEVVWEEKIGA